MNCENCSYYSCCSHQVEFCGYKSFTDTIENKYYISKEDLYCKECGYNNREDINSARKIMKDYMYKNSFKRVDKMNVKIYPYVQEDHCL
jgi:hypothetical protein